MKNERPASNNGHQKIDLQGRKVLLGVCGGIAAYKAIELARTLTKNGARVQVVMTDSATKFVAPLSFETVTGRNVFVEMFPAHGELSPWHTELASWADIVVVAPATANHMARLAAGIADDLLSTLMLTCERIKVLAPAMNPRMWANPATQDNLVVLKRRGYRVIMPEDGQMARPGEDEGIGRLAEPESIFREVLHILSAPQDLRGVRVLVTAGRTEESWDPVRVLTNRASGRMGFALAEEARERGADVLLIHGPTDVIPPTGVRIRKITSASEMAAAVKQEIHQAKVVLMSAAVSDYTFAETANHKIKKGDPSPEIHLSPTEDILKSISAHKGDRVIVGFALETENLLENALKKLREKHLDIVVANNPLTPGSGFAGETNQVLIIHRNGKVVDLPLQSKREVAREILNAVIHTYRNPEPEHETESEDIPEEFVPEMMFHDNAETDSIVAAPNQQKKKFAHEPRHKKTHHQKQSHQQVKAKDSVPLIPESKLQRTVEVVKTAPAESNLKIEPVMANATIDLPLPLPQTQQKKKNRRGGRRGSKARAAARVAREQGISEGHSQPSVVSNAVASPVAIAPPVAGDNASKKKPPKAKSKATLAEKLPKEKLAQPKPKKQPKPKAKKEA